ncbi:MAG: helix-turn-helix domain-containing protein [Alphaproteobacteria bacterium]
MNDENTVQNLTVGEILRNARTMGRRKREIGTIAKQLCIAEDFLEALENGDYKKIPEIVYVLGFARNYAMELGLDPDEIVDKVKAELGIEAENDTPVTIEDLAERDKTAEYKAKIQEFVRVAVDYVRRHWLWFAIGAGVLVVAMLIVIIFGGSNSAPADTPVAAPAPVVAAPVVEEPVYNIPVRERFGKENMAKSHVIIQAVEDSYVGVEDSRGKVIFGRSLVAGDVFYVPNGTGYKAKFGNAGGVDIWVDGELAPKVGANKTSKKDVSLNPDSLMKKSK